MKIMVGGPIFAGVVASRAPAGYVLAPPGYGLAPGRILRGPDNEYTTTVCLLPGDDGAWFTWLLPFDHFIRTQEVSG